jgi:hypothetical protein
MNTHVSRTRSRLLVAEANGNRSEIQRRSSSQHRLLALHITITSAIIGVGLGRPEYQLMLLVLPIASAVIGMLYLDHHLTIARIASHLATTYLTHRLNSYQVESVALRRTWSYFFLFAMPVMLVFTAVPACVVMWTFYDTMWQTINIFGKVLLSVGIVYLIYFSVAAVISFLSQPKTAVTSFSDKYEEL